MKKTMQKFLIVWIIIAVVFSGALSASAVSYSMTDAQWAEYWSGYTAEGRAVYLAPGADDTEMRFSWLCSAGAEKPAVIISENAGMANTKIFEGSAVWSKGTGFGAHVTATGLKENTTCYYQCRDAAGETAVKSFRTTAKGGDFSAIYLTDIHIGGDSLQNEALVQGSKNLNELFAQATEKENISLVVSGGDQATAGRLHEYIGLFASPFIKSVPFALTTGNHDNKALNYRFITNNPNLYQGARSPSWLGGDYWFVKGNALFLMIDSTNSSAVDHYNFVEQAVAANPEIKWRIAVFHHDLYGGHNPGRESENKLLRLLLTPIFDKFAVDLVLMGHSHVFSRSHVLYGNKISQYLDGKKSIRDAMGTIYLTSASASNPREAEQQGSEFVAVDHASSTDKIYNILNFRGDNLTIESYIVGQEQAFEVFTLEKTGLTGGHPDDSVPFWYPIVQWLGTVYNKINNLTRGFEYLFDL